MHPRLRLTAYLISVWLVQIGGAMSQAYGDPITYNVTALGNYSATGFDQSGNLIGTDTLSSNYSYTISGPSAGSLQVVANTGLTALNVPTQPGYASSVVEGGNASGQAVGFSMPIVPGGGPGLPVSWLYSGGQFTLLPGQNPASWSIDQASLQINASGQVIYTANDVSGNSHALLYSNGQAVDLGTLPGGIGSTSGGINNQGQIVGTSILGAGTAFYNAEPTAFIYEGGKMYNLNNLVLSESAPFYLTGAVAINNLGQVLAWGTGGGYLLTPSNLPAVPPPPTWAVPAPEPSTIVLFSLVVACLGYRECNRKRKSTI